MHMFRPGKDRFLGLGVAAVDKWPADATAQSQAAAGHLSAAAPVGVAIANLRLRSGSLAQGYVKRHGPAPSRLGSSLSLIRAVQKR
jgi:hypothetical protein